MPDGYLSRLFIGCLFLGRQFAMSEGYTIDLLLLALCAGGASALIATRGMPLVWALLLAAARCSFPLVYFASYYDATWNVGDDLVYFAQGSELVRCGYNPLTIVLYHDGWEYLHFLSGGHHVLYGWWNLSCVWLFGEHYYAPVFGNVVLTFVGASLLAQTARQLGFSATYALWLEVFWLVHWDLISWSSILNIKDVLVQTMTIAVWYCLLAYVNQRKRQYLVGFLLIGTLFWWLRFYVPVLVLTAVMVWMLTQWNDPRRYLFLPLGAIGYLFALPLIWGVSDYWHFDEFLYGAVRFSLTPTPWTVHEVYGYLTIPTALHWIMFVPALLGSVWLWMESRGARVFLIYLACLIAMYAVTEELLGPRQRFQVAFLFAWAQFHFLWCMRPATPVAASRSAATPTWSQRLDRLGVPPLEVAR